MGSSRRAARPRGFFCCGRFPARPELTRLFSWHAFAYIATSGEGKRHGYEGGGGRTTPPACRAGTLKSLLPCKKAKFAGFRFSKQNAKNLWRPVSLCLLTVLAGA